MHSNEGRSPSCCSTYRFARTVYRSNGKETTWYPAGRAFTLAPLLLVGGDLGLRLGHARVLIAGWLGLLASDLFASDAALLTEWETIIEIAKIFRPASAVLLLPNLWAIWRENCKSEFSQTFSIGLGLLGVLSVLGFLTGTRLSDAQSSSATKYRGVIFDGIMLVVSLLVLDHTRPVGGSRTGWKYISEVFASLSATITLSHGPVDHAKWLRLGIPCLSLLGLIAVYVAIHTKAGFSDLPTSEDRRRAKHVVLSTSVLMFCWSALVIRAQGNSLRSSDDFGASVGPVRDICWIVALAVIMAIFGGRQNLLLLMGAIGCLVGDITYLQAWSEGSASLRIMLSNALTFSGTAIVFATVMGHVQGAITDAREALTAGLVYMVIIWSTPLASDIPRWLEAYTSASMTSVGVVLMYNSLAVVLSLAAASIAAPT